MRAYQPCQRLLLSGELEPATKRFRDLLHDIPPGQESWLPVEDLQQKKDSFPDHLKRPDLPILSPCSYTSKTSWEVDIYHLAMTLICNFPRQQLPYAVVAGLALHSVYTLGWVWWMNTFNFAKFSYEID
jgi:hypothetical protein